MPKNFSMCFLKCVPVIILRFRLMVYSNKKILYYDCCIGQRLGGAFGVQACVELSRSGSFFRRLGASCSGARA